MSFSVNSKCNFESPDTKIPADPDIDGWGVISAFFVTALCSMFLVITAFILQRASNIIHFIFPDDAWRRWRETRYYRIQKVLSALADQQLISGMGILIAGIIRSRKMSYFHLMQVGNLAGLSNLAIIYSLEYENLELAPLAPAVRPNLRTKSPINIARASLAILYLILLISFNVVSYRRCEKVKAENWTLEYDVPMNCYQKLWDFEGCLPGAVIFSLWPIYDYISALCRRSETARTLVLTSLWYLISFIFAIMEVPFWILRTIAKCSNQDRVGSFLDEHRPWKLLNDVLIGERWKKFRQDGHLQRIQHFVYIGTMILWFLLSGFDVFDLKISSMSVLDPNENDIGFGQVLAIAMLFVLPLTVLQTFDEKR